MVRSYKDLRVWNLAMNLVERTYRLTRSFPREEAYVLTGQLRRAAVSIPSNIAEGHSRSGKEFPRYLSIASGSLAEIETQIEIAHRLGYVQANDALEFERQADSLGRQIRALTKALQRSASPQTPDPRPQ